MNIPMPVEDSILEINSQNQTVRPRQVGIVMFDDFNMSEFSIAIDVMSKANKYAGHALFEWKIFGVDRLNIHSDTGFAIQADAMIDECRGDIILVLGAETLIDTHASDISRLRRLLLIAPKIIASSEAAVALCKSGLVKGGRVTFPSCYEAPLVEECPHLEFTQTLFETNGRITLCRGGTALLDLMICEIIEQVGADVGYALAEAFVVPRVRTGGERVPSFLQRHVRTRAPHLNEAIKLMEQNIETPILAKDLARRFSISTRQLQRMFKAGLGKSPSTVYKELRLHRARELLVETTMSITEISIASGFATCSNFSQDFRKHFGCRPKDIRPL